MDRTERDAFYSHAATELELWLMNDSGAYHGYYLPVAQNLERKWRKGTFDLTLGKAMYAGFTMGGLRTSVDGQVLRPDGSVIAGLYAAGACAANIAQDSLGYSSGTQLGEGSFFGRRAGRHAAAQH